MPRFRLHRIVMPRGARLLMAAGLTLACGHALAQSAATPVTDPLAPKLQSDPRNPPTFQKTKKPALAQTDTTSFVPPVSGAGTTGFDATNSRKPKPKTKPKPKAQTITPPPVPLSTRPASGAYAAAPDEPPVELGLIRQTPKRKARNDTPDPYEPLGVHAGAFMLYPAIELIGGYDTNPAHVAGGSGASLYTVAPELRVQSDWSRHEFKADLRGSYTGYKPDESPTLSRPYVDGKVDGRIDVTKDTRIDLAGRVLVSTDNPGSPNLPAGLSKLPIFSTFGGSAGVGERFNRLDLSLKADAQRTVYQDSVLVDGSTFSNDDRNYNQFGGTLRGGYELSPGVTPFVEIGADKRVHDLNVDTSGFQRDSKGLTGSVGTTFELTRQLTGEVSVGYTGRSYEDPRLQKARGLIADASLIWTANALTTVKLTGKSTVGESTVPEVSGVLYRDVGLQIDHSLRRWLIGSVKLGFGLDDYVGIDRLDKRFSAGVGLTYKLNRSVQIKGEFRQEWLRSNVTGNDYTSSIFLLGLRLQR